MNSLKLRLQNKIFEFKNRSRHIKIHFQARIQNSKLGLFNTINSNAEIINCKIDDFVYVSSGTKISNTTIGKFCSIGPDCKIGLGMHPTDYISTFPAFFSTKNQCQISFVKKDEFRETKKITIGNDVWIGANAIILDGIVVGDGAIIAAAAVVTKNVDPFSIVAGVPAKEIKKRFTTEEINKLIKIKWWEKDLSWLKCNALLFKSKSQFFLKFA
jgi:acetyltransferase-like isoleucine patch superfamily enzyme